MSVIDPRLSRIRVVLVNTTHPGNIGASARAMFTMGIERLVLVAPHRFPGGEATARASGATHVLEEAVVVASLDEALEDASLTIGFSARRREFAGQVMNVRDAATRVVQAAATSDVALVFGTEMSGLSNDELARCGVVATIPCNPAYSSLNLAAAVQVAVYEVFVAIAGQSVWTAPRFAAATHDEIEGLHAHAARTLAALDFLDRRMPRRLMPRLRRLFARSGLEREEVNILRGILARVDERIDG
ncbi:MAG TPA: RNA methyltransferase [Casimicrobiaceae bacterium]|nr:RNA methyltransferase [Casimicrobiaceae bacterium]